MIYYLQYIMGSNKGGTANCVNYAKSLGVNIEYINPLEVLV